MINFWVFIRVGPDFLRFMGAWLSRWFFMFKFWSIFEWNNLAVLFEHISFQTGDGKGSPKKDGNCQRKSEKLSMLPRPASYWRACMETEREMLNGKKGLQR